MNCLACKSSDTKIKESFDRGPTVERRRICSCGATFCTTETADASTLVRSPDPQAHPVSAPGRPRPTQIPPVSTQGRPPPGQNSTPRADSGRGGVGGGLSSGPDPVRIGSEKEGDLDPEIWDPTVWNRRYGDAWMVKYKRFYGMAGDSKGCGNLADLLERLPRAEVLEAQQRAPRMFAAFLASESPAVVNAKHPFAFFVTAFGSLRVDDPGDSTGKKLPEYG